MASVRDRSAKGTAGTVLKYAALSLGALLMLAPFFDMFIGGSNLTSTKARLLLMASLMRFGALPPAADPDRPTAGESEATLKKISEYQDVFDTH